MTEFDPGWTVSALAGTVLWMALGWEVRLLLERAERRREIRRGGKH